MARWALLDATGSDGKCQRATEQINALIHAGMTIPIRRSNTNYSAFKPSPDEADANAWLTEHGVKIGLEYEKDVVYISYSVGIPNDLKDALDKVRVCRPAYERLSDLRAALKASGQAEKVVKYIGVSNDDLIELTELKLAFSVEPISMHQALELRMVELLRRYPENQSVNSTAKTVQRWLREAQEDLPYCGGLCKTNRNIIKAAREPADEGHFHTTGHCAPLLKAAREVPPRQSRGFGSPPAVPFRESASAEAAWFLRGAGCVKPVPGFANLDAVKAYVGTCATVEGDNWTPWLKASRQAALSGCAKPPEWAMK